MRLAGARFFRRRSIGAEQIEQRALAGIAVACLGVGLGQRAVDLRQQLRAIRAEVVAGAGFHQALEQLLVHAARLDARAEIVQVGGTGRRLSRAAMISSTAACADILDRGKAEADRVRSFTVKTLPLSFTLGRQDLDAHRLRLGHEERDLVGVVELVGEQRGHELRPGSAP